MAVCFCDHHGNTAEENSMDLLLLKQKVLTLKRQGKNLTPATSLVKNVQVCMHVFNIPYLFTKN